MPVTANEPSLPPKNVTQTSPQEQVSPPLHFGQPGPARVNSGQSVLQVILDEIMRRLKSAKLPIKQITRGNVCPITPGRLEKQNRIYSVRPLFMWQGHADTIKIYNYWTDAVIGQASIPPGVTSYMYSGESLQVGQPYIWVLEKDQKLLSQVEFEIMLKTERDQIISQKSQTQDLQDATLLALYEANYFSKSELWSDMLTAMSQANHQSVDATLNALNQDLCSASSPVQVPQS